MPDQVVVREPEAEAPKTVVRPWSSATVFLAVGWTGVVLAVAALVDYAQAFIPTAFSSLAWEFGTISQFVAGLPLLALGLAAIWVSGAGTGRRRVLLTVGVVLELVALILVVLLLAFVLDVPAALRGAPLEAKAAVKRVAVKTLALGVLFGASFIAAGVLALKQARGVSSRGAGA